MLDSQDSDAQDIEIIDDLRIDATLMLSALKKRRRRNAARFVAGLLLIVVPGAIWAATSKDPIRGFDDNQVFPGGPFFEGDAEVDFGFGEAPVEFFEAPATTFVVDN